MIESITNRHAFPLYAFILAILLLAQTGCPAPKPPDEPDEGNGTDEINKPDGPVRIAFVPSVEIGGMGMELEVFDLKLSELIGHEVESHIVLTYSACIEQMAAGHHEAAFLPSFAYVLAHERYNVQVALKAVRNGSPTYRGQIITRVDSGIETIQDLVDRTFGYTDVSSASGHLYPKTYLISEGIDPDTDLAEVTFVGNHPMVVEAVLTGRVDAGATFDDARLRLVDTEPTVMDEIRIIGYTSDIPSDTFSLREDCTGEFYDRLIDAIMELSRVGAGDEAEGIEPGILYTLYEVEEFVPAEDSDYDPIREMVSTLDLDIEAELD